MAARTPPLDVSQIPPPPDFAQPPADAIPTSPGGFNGRVLLSKVLKPGRGEARPTEHDVCTVHYTAWAADGTTIGDSRSRGAPAVWTWPQMMVGLRLGVETMAAGEQRRLWIPQELTHQWAQGPVVFDVELIAFAPSGAPTSNEFSALPADAERSATGIARKVLRAGSGAVRPKPLSTVTIHYTAWTKGGIAFDDSVGRRQPFTVAVDAVIPGLSDALQQMVVGEKSRFWIPADLAYQPPGPPRSSLIFDVELLDIQKAAAGQPGTIDVRSNSPDASYLLVQPDGVALPGRGPRTFSTVVPGRYRIKPDTMRSYALGLLAVPADMVLAPAGRLAITITYRPIIQ